MFENVVERNDVEEICRVRSLCFFFQAEDGIRDLTVTGVQTCALPIYSGGDTGKRLTPRVSIYAAGMADGVGVEWVQTSKPGLVSRAPEEFEGELRELRDEVRRLREQVAALAAATARPPPVDERLPTFVARLDPFLEGGVPRGSVLAISGPGGSMETSLALYLLLTH